MDTTDPLDGYRPDTWTLTELTVEGTTLADLHTVALWEGTVSVPWRVTLIGKPA